MPQLKSQNQIFSSVWCLEGTFAGLLLNLHAHIQIDSPLINLYILKITQNAMPKVYTLYELLLFFPWLHLLPKIAHQLHCSVWKCCGAALRCSRSQWHPYQPRERKKNNTVWCINMQLERKEPVLKLNNWSSYCYLKSKMTATHFCKISWMQIVLQLTQFSNRTSSGSNNGKLKIKPHWKRGQYG